MQRLEAYFFFKTAYLRQLLASINAKPLLGCQIAQQKTRVKKKRFGKNATNVAKLKQ